MATNALANQISNRNFLSPTGFKFTLAKYPKVAFFCNSAKIPEITLNTLIQPDYLNDIPQPGGKMTFGDLNLRFLVDENLENYMVIHNWITAFGGSGSLEEYRVLIRDANGTVDYDRAYSDGSLYVLNSNYGSTAVVKFKNLFPVSLTSLDFDSTVTDINYFTAEVAFKYTIYDILGTDGKPLYPFTST
jgi:hypothetical protein